ncbi:hypothetical protein Taro_032569 [Colocasia esculenta]|uniref:Uncharacterized protein n=1 Tax=Colocasia esculenta TaxID=4460 RepID=A0A843W2A1_COLES|nr:hypothetical protein [Colocasia esculenta]
MIRLMQSNVIMKDSTYAVECQVCVFLAEEVLKAVVAVDVGRLLASEPRKNLVFLCSSSYLLLSLSGIYEWVV